MWVIDILELRRLELRLGSEVNQVKVKILVGEKDSMFHNNAGL